MLADGSGGLGRLNRAALGETGSNPVERGARFDEVAELGREKGEMGGTPEVWLFE